MIIVWDNGESYGSEQTHFIDTMDYDIEDCLKLLKSYEEKGFLVAKVHNIEWVEGNATNVDDFVCFWTLRNKSVIRDIKPETLKGFFVKWKEAEENRLRRFKVKADETGNYKWYNSIKRRYDTDFAALEKFCEEL